LHKQGESVMSAKMRSSAELIKINISNNQWIKMWH